MGAGRGRVKPGICPWIWGGIKVQEKDTHQILITVFKNCIQKERKKNKYELD
jgi:hypothetical protein